MNHFSLIISLQSQTGPTSRQFKISLKFWPKKICKQEFKIKYDQIKSTIETRFIAQLERLIGRDLKNLQRKAVAEDVIVTSKTSGAQNTSEGEAEDVNVDGEEAEKPSDTSAKKSFGEADDENSAAAAGNEDSETDDEDALEQIGDGDAKQDDRMHKKNYDDDEESDAEDVEVATPEEAETPDPEDKARENVITGYKYVTDYNFHTKSHRCEITLEV